MIDMNTLKNNLKATQKPASQDTLSGAADVNPVQSSFIDLMVNNSTRVSIFLLSGIKLDGIILSHDNSAVILVNNGNAQLIYKRAVATISPNKNIDRQ